MSGCSAPRTKVSVLGGEGLWKKFILKDLEASRGRAWMLHGRGEGAVGAVQAQQTFAIARVTCADRAWAVW